MAWFKVDDGFWSHPKTLRLSTDAVALWVRAGSWSCQQLTDGLIEHHVLSMFGASETIAAELVRVGYWEPEETGFVFHDWEDYQEESEKVKARREAARERMRTVRANRERTKGERAQELRAKFAESSPNPDPTRPDPTRPTSPNGEVSTTPKGVAPRKRGTRIPEPFIVNRDMRDWAAREVPAVDVDGATRKFVDHWRATTGRTATKLDWIAAWRNWLRNEHDRAPQHKPTKDERALAVLEMGRQLAAREQGKEITA